MLHVEEYIGAGNKDLPVIEPCEDNLQGENTGSSRASEDLDDIFYDGGGAGDVQYSLLRHRSSVSGAKAYEAPRGYLPRGAPSTSTTIEASGEQVAKQTQQRHSGMRTPPQYYRLSMPPSIKLDPPQASSKPRPTGPHKSDSSPSTSYRPHPAYPFKDWRQRTPSPVKSIRDGITTPPLEKRKLQGFRVSSLVNVFTSTWKRRATSGLGSSGSADRQSGARSMSH